MFWFFILSIVPLCHCQSVTVTQTGVCTGDFCDPSYLPYPNMNAALYGYDISKADPFSTRNVGGDPGWRFPIFMATTGSSLIKGAVQLHESIEAKDNLQCLGHLEMTEINNIKQYKEAQLKSSYRGLDMQIGQEQQVEIGVSVPLGSSGAAGEAKSTTTIPPFLTRSNSNTESESKITSFFSREGGRMIKMEATCSVSSVFVLPGVVPLFNIGFVNAVKALATATTLSETSKLLAFRAFIRNYGTHYSQQTVMGSKLVYTMRFTIDERQEDTRTNMRDCTEVQGLKIFGIQVEKNKKDCKSESKYTNEIKSEYVSRQSYASFGSKPASTLSEWSKQEFTQPMPLNMALVPLPNLFTYENLNAIGNIASVTIDQKALLDWFLPMWKNMCKVLNIPCDHGGKGCGYDDDCEWGQICESSDSEKGYKCTSNYRPDFDQTVCTDSGGGRSANSLIYLDRHRIACGSGLNPFVSQFRVSGCGPSRINYGYTCVGGPSTSRCFNTKTFCNYQGPGDGQLIYLDRHRMDCSDNGRRHGYFMNEFHLNRCSGTTNVEYQYRCCKKNAGDGVCRTRQTGINPAPRLLYLDRHNINCQGDYLRDIQLINSGLLSHGFYMIHYKYTCCDACKGNPSQCTAIQNQLEYKQTTCTDTTGHDFSRSIIYLDRHDLNCGLNLNRWITRFRAVNCYYDKDHYIYYDYTCKGDGRANSNCIHSKTNCDTQGGGDGEVIYLDRHPVRCTQSGYFLSRSHLVRCDAGRKIQYEFTCCKKSSNDGACVTKETSKQPFNGNIFFDRHNIDCGGKYLKYFRMFNTRDYKNIYYEYTCCEG